MKKCIALALALALLASLAGCGQPEVSAFRALEVLGEKQFSAICRGGDKLAPLIDAALKTLAGNGQLSAQAEAYQKTEYEQGFIAPGQGTHPRGQTVEEHGQGKDPLAADAVSEGSGQHCT
jgi:hypothetical protein